LLPWYVLKSKIKENFNGKSIFPCHIIRSTGQPGCFEKPAERIPTPTEPDLETTSSNTCYPGTNFYLTKKKNV